MKLMNETDILKEEFRLKVITEILGPENFARKNKARKKHEIYKDQTKKYVIESLLGEFKPETVVRMQNRAANISIAKKIVNKKARAYEGGVSREFSGDESEKSKQDLDSMSNLLCINEKMKKTDKFTELFKNCAIQVMPERSSLETDYNADVFKYKTKLRVLPPYLYDVIEDCYDREIPKVFILSDFVSRQDLGLQTMNTDSNGKRNNSAVNFGRAGDGVDQTIADSPADSGADMRTFIWWSDNFHFTTDDKGKIIPVLSPVEDNYKNPIGKLPFINVAIEQDGKFWAEGGDDLIDGSVLINVLITDMFAISNQQGWGQLVIKGKNVKKKIEGGPHTALTFEYDTGDPEPSVEFVSSNPPIQNWMLMIEQYVALLLSTNNLSSKNVAAKLDVQTAPSGVAMLIDNSESTADVTEKQNLFKDKEPQVWDRVILWHNFLFERGNLIDSEKELGKLPDDKPVYPEFYQSQPVITESENLDNLKKRKDLGIDRQVDLIMMDNPGMTEEDAEKKLAEIIAEKAKQLGTALVDAATTQGAQNGLQQEKTGQGQQDQNQV